MEPLTLSATPPKADWLVEQILPRGHLSMFYAPAGVGKTRLISYLAVQTTRPQGEGHFLGRNTRQGRVVILDADDPTGFGYQSWLNRFLNGYPDAQRNRLELRAVTGGLTPEDVQGLREQLEPDPPVLVVLDTFASAFVGLDILKAHHVQAALTALAELAKSLNCALVVLDHVGKLKPGETVASKGAYGAAKNFSPRAVFAIDRVPPREVDGKDVLRLICTKMSYAVEPAPIGFSITLEQNDTVATCQVEKLPDASRLTDRAKAAMALALKGGQGQPIARKALLGIAVQQANCTERWAIKALEELEAEMGDDLEQVDLGGRGNPKGYLMKPEGFDEHPTSSNPIPSQTAETPFDELFTPPLEESSPAICGVSSSSNQTNTVPDGKRFDEHPTSSNQTASSNPEGVSWHELD